MIEIGNITLIIIFQVMFVLFVSVVFLVFLLRSKNTNIEKLIVKAGKHEEVSPTSSVKFYLVAEAKLVENRFNQLYTEKHLQELELCEADWLNLRKSFLELEQILLLNEAKVDNFWLDYGVSVKEILDNNNLVKRMKIIGSKEEELEEGEIDMRELLKRQYDEFDNIYLELEGEKSEDEIKALRERLNTVIRCHTELSHCVHMIEGENEFLKTQISELVKNPV